MAMTNYYRILNSELQKLVKETGVNCLADVEMLWDRGTSILVGFIPFGANFAMSTKEIDDHSKNETLQPALKNRIINSVREAIKVLEKDIENLI